jgi:hypothetical protein
VGGDPTRISRANYEQANSSWDELEIWKSKRRHDLTFNFVDPKSTLRDRYLKSRQTGIFGG